MKDVLAESTNDNILKLENLKMYFPVSRGFLSPKTYVKAVDGVSFSVKRGETFGLVGESGCGKTTLGKCILKLYELTGGKIVFEGRDISRLSLAEFLPIRKKIQMIFQDPYACLNPRLKVKELVAEPLRFQRMKLSKKEIDEAVDKVLSDVRINPKYKNRFPHEFSGGQQQRIGIARALILKPDFIVCDEPVSALDVSVQAQIINLLNDLQKEYKLTYLFISHDLSVVKFISKRVGIMYLGRIVELGDSDIIFSNPVHPYTKSLLSAVPIIDSDVRKKRIILKGEIPSPFNIPLGCRFHPRCNYATDICKQEEPETTKISENHYVWCHNYRKH